LFSFEFLNAILLYLKPVLADLAAGTQSLIAASVPIPKAG